MKDSTKNILRVLLTAIAGGGVATATFFLSDAALPEGTSWWVHWAMTDASFASYALGAGATTLMMHRDTERLRGEASDLGTALAVERERTERLREDLDTGRSLRAGDRTVADGRLDELRRAHKEQMDALVERHMEEERVLRLSQQAAEACLRETIERKDSLRDADRALSQERVEGLLRENGDLKAEVAKWKAMCGSVRTGS